jgi:tetratricopeptide (TPR) repeat protein
MNEGLHLRSISIFRVKTFRTAVWLTVFLAQFLLLSGCGGKEDRAQELFFRAKLALGEKRYSDALRYLAQAVKLDSNFKEAQANLGSTLAEVGEYSKAIQAFDKAIALDKNYALAYYNKANTLFRMGQFEKSLTCIERAVALAPDSSSFQINYGTILNELKLYPKALAAFLKAQELSSQDPTLLSNLSAAYLMNGDTAKAEEFARKALKENQAVDFAQNNLGLIALSRNQIQAAIEHFQAGLEVVPSNSALLNNLSYCLFEQKDTAQALTFVNKALIYGPKNALAHRNKSLYLKDPKQSLEFALKALELDSLVWDGHSVLALAQLKSGQKSEACLSLSKAAAKSQNLFGLKNLCR